jgi:hypothetical protein
MAFLHVDSRTMHFHNVHALMPMCMFCIQTVHTCPLIMSMRCMKHCAHAVHAGNVYLAKAHTRTRRRARASPLSPAPNKRCRIVRISTSLSHYPPTLSTRLNRYVLSHRFKYLRSSLNIEACHTHRVLAVELVLNPTVFVLSFSIFLTFLIFRLLKPH